MRGLQITERTKQIVDEYAGIFRLSLLYPLLELPMISTQLKTAVSFALSGATLALAASAYAADAPKGAGGKAIAANDKVHCYNVHDCKGNSDCKTAEHSCKGQNACKGHGFKGMAAAECLSVKGTIGDL